MVDVDVEARSCAFAPGVVEARQSRVALARVLSDMGCVTIQRTPVKHTAADRRCRLFRAKVLPDRG